MSIGKYLRIISMFVMLVSFFSSSLVIVIAMFLLCISMLSLCQISCVIGMERLSHFLAKLCKIIDKSVILTSIIEISL